MPGATREAREALRTLLLPIDEKAEDFALQAALREAASLQVSEGDFALFINAELSEWQTSEAPSTALVNVANAAIMASDDDAGRRIANKYFKTHRQLQSDTYLLSFSQATRLLSHSRLAALLASVSNLTASQISRLINTRDPRVESSRSSVAYILAQFGLPASVTADQVCDLFEADRDLSITVFADASLDECAAMVGEVARRLGCNLNFGRDLSVLAPSTNLGAHVAYLQILHYQCSVAEFYDFAVKDIYEFSPRGNAVAELCARYPASIVDAGNPFLNNAKSVEQLTPAWARSKVRQGLYPGAMALYRILDELQSLGFLARQELASWVRIWIHRILLLAEGSQIVMPAGLSSEEAETLLGAVAQGNTQTSGILEQRVVDALSALIHDAPTWRSRGLGDSVNATNVSKRKLGDCDFQNIDEKKVVAYEAHGGRLTTAYLRAHLSTLKKTLPARIEQWETITGADGWNVKVVFVAHENAVDPMPAPFVEQGVNFEIEVVDYRTLMGRTLAPRRVVFLERHFLKPLSKPSVPDRIKRAVCEILGG